MSATDSREPWFERDPTRLQWELDEFARHSLQVEYSEDDNRRLVVWVTHGLVFRGQSIKVRVVYPHGYPYFAPVVYGDALLLDRHQDLVTLNYCLLEDPERDWGTGRSAGHLVGKMLRRLLADSTAGEAKVRAGEANMPEPPLSQFPYGHRQVTLVPEPFLAHELSSTRGGDMRLACDDDGRLCMLVQASGIGEADPGLIERFLPAPKEIGGRWVALARVQPQRPPAFRMLEAVAEVDATSKRRLSRRLKNKQKLQSASEMLGVTFLEQGPTRDETRRNWLFACVRQERGGRPEVRWFMRAQALSLAERQRRIPELAGLAGVRVAVVGAGSLGAPVALELAKAGVGVLDIIDCDTYDVNNSVRHVIDSREAGNEKTAAVGEYCRALNPFIDIRVHQTLIGHPLDDKGLLDELMREAVVIIDTTGSYALARLLSDRCSESGTPLIIAGLTTASYGGEIFVVANGLCFECFVGAQERGEIPEPPAGERSTVTPVGCRHPAFAGAGFEAAELAAITARTAVRCTGATTYPSPSANWIVLDFRGSDHYRQGKINIQQECRAHGSDA